MRQKEIFKNLSTDSKLELWKSKLEQVAREDISDEQKKLITKISDELSTIKDDNFDGQKLFEYAIRMAQITPEDEFIRMFSQIGDYKRNEDSYKGFVASTKKTSSKSHIEADLVDYLSKMKEGKAKAELYKDSNISINARKRPCNCKWTCGFYESIKSDNCIPSTGGCGFLWIQECTGYVGF
ncbi:MAG: bacteriocin fulvocin C-related protein [Bergeyella cardium]